MKSLLFKSLSLALLVGMPATAAEIPPSAIKWPRGAEAVIDRAIAIKVVAEKQDVTMESKDGMQGRAFVKCMDELAAILAGSNGVEEKLKEAEGRDLKAKIAIWALDRKARPDEYARLEHLHVSDNPVGEAAAERKAETARSAARQNANNRDASGTTQGHVVRKVPQPVVIPPQPVAVADAVEGNRLILEYLYFAPPCSGRTHANFLYVLSEALCNVRSERSLAMLKFDLENQIEASPSGKPQDRTWQWFGGEVCRILDYRTAEAFSIAASFMHHEGVRERMKVWLDAFAGGSIPYEKSLYLVWKPRFDAYKKLAEMEWKTEEEWKLAAQIKAIPPIAPPQYPEALRKEYRRKSLEGNRVPNTDRFLSIAAGEYHWRYLEAIDAGELDLIENIIPEKIANDARARAYYHAGYIRGVLEYQIESGLKNSNSQRPCIPRHGVLSWELEGFIKGCSVARAVGSAIQKDIQDVLVRELQRDDSTPDSAIEAALRVIEQQRDDRERRAEQPANKPADQAPAEVRPPPPTSKDVPHSTKAKISEQQFPKLPTSVHYSADPDGTHVVLIDGIGAAPIHVGERPDPKLGCSLCPLDSIPTLPERVSFEVDHEKRTCTLVTSRELKRSELSAAIDETAKVRSDIPCWAELEARDLERAAEYRDDRYVPEKVDGEVPSGLAWFYLVGSQSFSAPFEVKFPAHPLGRLLIVPTAVPRGSQRHYTIRVLDHDGRILWSDTSTAFGIPRIAVGDSNGDDRHEIYVESDDHGGKKLFHIKPASEQAGAGQPATKPRVNPFVKDQPSPPTSKDAPRDQDSTDRES